MNNHYKNKIISIVSCVVLTALFITVFFFSYPRIAVTPEADGTLTYPAYALPDGTLISERITAEIGKDITAVRISDLGELQTINKVNYVPDMFLPPGTLSKEIQIVDLSQPFAFAEKGTLIFIILNLDPSAEDFSKKVEDLIEYKIGDYWRFTLLLPEIFCASNVYQKSQLITRHGEIENYDFIKYNTSYDKRTEEFSSQTATTYLDLSFYTRREALDNIYGSAQIVTVHYQSQGGVYSGINGTPLIGGEDAVKGISELSQNLLIIVSILSAVVFCVLVVLSILEGSKEFVSAIVWMAGITLLLLSRYFLGGDTGVPLFWAAVALAAPFVILGGAQLAISRKFGKVSAKYMICAFTAAGAVLALVIPFIPVYAAGLIRTLCIIIKAVGVVTLLLYLGFAIFNKNVDHGILQTLCAAIIAVGICASLFLPHIFPAQYNSLFWLCAVTTVITFISVFVVFLEMKKSNVYLTANLQKEVERQVKDIKAVITERDNLLQFVSHDMKKPLVVSESLIDSLMEREKDVEQTKALRIVKQNTSRVVSNLSEIGVYAKFNYIAESSQVVDLAELCTLLFKYHELDCNANGIVLKNLVDKKIKAFVKKQGLENVVSNIIMNAVEHADCTTITLSIKQDKNKILLCVADNGKGVGADIDVFKPYISENNTDTGGVGLYICKNIIESMNGELSFVSQPGNTVFYISLLKA